MKHFTKSIHRNNEGQALLFVVVALAISMVVGVSISTRTLSLSRRVANTDTHSRVYYSAEAGIERFVDLSMDDLMDISIGTDCGENTGAEQTDNGDCIFYLGDDIETSTEVTVEAITYNESSPRNHYAVEVKNGAFAGINLGAGLNGNSISVCWKSLESAPAALYYSHWDPNGLKTKNIYYPATGNVGLDGTITTNLTASSASGAMASYYTSCITISTTGQNAFLNVSPLGSDAKIGVFPASSGAATLPPQGFRIISKAKLRNDDTNQVQVTKIIEVVRSYDRVPGFFDAALYAQGSIMED